MNTYLCLPDEDLNLGNQTLVMRVDFNSPIDNEQPIPVLKGTRRIDDHLSTTIIPLFNRPNPPRNIVLLAHQGRLGQWDCTTLRPHFEYCRTVLQSHQIKMFYFGEEYTDRELIGLGAAAVASDTVLDRIYRLRERSVLLLENVRFAEGNSSKEIFRAGEFSSTPLIQMLTKVPNKIMVLDGFSVAHRAQASVVGLADVGLLYAGPVMVREIAQLSHALVRPEHPMLLVVGGAKVDDSLRSIERFLSCGIAHEVLTGGLVGMIFLAAKGVKLNSLTLDNLRKASADVPAATEYARKLLNDYGKGLIKTPTDVAYAPRQGLLSDRVTVAVDGNLEAVRHEIGDIGVETIAAFNHEIAKARTIVLNGPMGRYEYQSFALGTQEVLRYVGLVAHDKSANALVGGGDTGAALGGLEREYALKVKECSSGKAFLQVLASGDVESLPGVRALARRGELNVRQAAVSS